MDTSSSDSPKLSSIGDFLKPTNTVCRTQYVDVNKMVWKHFKECQAAGIQISRKDLKEEAKKCARALGIESFRGSEGWLDGFKRRHKIDLKTMTGFPVHYEKDIDDESSHMRPFKPNYSCPTPTFITAPEEFASTLLNHFNASQNPMLAPYQLEHTTPSSYLLNMINTMSSTTSTMDVSQVSNALSDSNENVMQDEADTVKTVFNGCTIKAQNKEVSHALDTIRSFIMSHDPMSMNLLLQVQERLAAAVELEAPVNRTEGPSTSYN